MDGGVDARRAARVRIPGMALAVLVLLVLAVGSLAPAVSTALQQQQRIADAEAQVAAQQADLAGLTSARARWDDPAYVRAQAGSRLFYVLPGTTAYRVIHGSADRAAAPVPAATAQPAEAPWTSVLLDSLVDAGTTASAPGDLGR